MKSRNLVFLLGGCLLVADGEFVCCRDRPAVIQSQSQQASASNVVSSRQATQRIPDGATILLYGKASVSEDERRILYKPFQDYMKRPYRGQDYVVGMICLKHRLKRSEVMELIAETPFKSDALTLLDYNTSISTSITFLFDERGNLLSVRTTGSIYQLPPLESVHPDTSLDLPPLSEETKRLLEWEQKSWADRDDANK